MVKRFHGSRRFIFMGSWSATHVLLSFVGSELPRGLGAYVSPYLYSAINVLVMFIRKNKIRIRILQPVDGATDGATRRVICPASVLILYTVIMTGCAALKYPVQIRICILSMCYECTDNHDMYRDYLSKIAVFTAGIDSRGLRVFLLLVILMQIYPKHRLLEAFYVTSAMTIRSL